MKKLFFLLSLCLLVFAAQAEEKPYFVKTFKSAGINLLEVKTSGGGINVEGTGGSDAKVEVYIKGNNGRVLSESEIADKLKDYTLTVAKEGSTLVCVAKAKDKINWKSALSISFKIYTPRKVNTDLNTSGGGIKLANLSGDLKFITSGGGLDLVGLSGNVKGKTSGGGIKIKNSEDKIDLSTSGGGIDADQLSGEINLSTSGGGIRLSNLSGMVKASTSGGGVQVDNVDGELVTSTSGGSIKLADIKGSVKANTSGGGIHADINKVGDYLVLHSSGGNINVNMPMDKGMNLDIKGDRVSMNKSSSFSGSMEKNRVRGTVNGGGADVQISTSAGSVNIN